MGPEFDLVLARNFAIALLIGAMVGIEREKHKVQEGESGPGGIRTFILFALAGAVSAWLSGTLSSPWPFAVTVLGVSALVVVGYLAQARRSPEHLGLTTEMAAIAVCLLGGAALAGHPGIAVALGIVTSAALAFKAPLHGIVKRIGTEDLYAGLRLLVATFIVLPLLPNRAVDPWGAVNPYTTWLLVILISLMSLAGYVAVRWLGPERGAAVTGLAGGLVSSTAVTLTFAKNSREGRQASLQGDALASGMLVAWAVMLGRIVVESAVVYPALLRLLLVPVTGMAVVTLAAAAWFYRRGKARPAAPVTGQAQVPLRNPFSLTAAARFALLFTAVLLLVKLASESLPGTGVYVDAGNAGLTDVDAVTLSMAGLAREGGDPLTAVRAIALAALANTLVKCGVASVLGSAALRSRILPATALILAAGTLAALLM